jgi:hypothetical protein
MVICKTEIQNDFTTRLRKTYSQCSGLLRLYPMLIHLREEIVQDLRLHPESGP